MAEQVYRDSVIYESEASLEAYARGELTIDRISESPRLAAGRDIVGFAESVAGKDAGAVLLLLIGYGLAQGGGKEGAGPTSGGGSGLVYLRTDASGTIRPYVGQPVSDSRFVARQREHARDYPDAEFGYEVLSRAPAGAQLSRHEEYFIRLKGGPTTPANPNGLLSNRRDEMNPSRYEASGGDPW